MAKQQSKSDPKKTLLIKPREVFKKEILERLEIGKELYKKNITTIDQLDELKKDYNKWNDYNEELLKSSFDSHYSTNEYYSAYSRINSMTGFYDRSMGKRIDTPEYKKELLKTKIERCNNWLEQITDKVNIISVDSSVEQYQIKEKMFYNKGFIIHGHNQVRELEIARFLENDLRLKTIILHEQPNKGQTIIEKFENYSAVDFAVAIWTADDVGKAKNEENLKDRARQNVIFETGFFIGALGRKNVIVLYENGVEIPSDYSGVLFIKLIDNWKDDLRKEIDAIYKV